jgi:hypothetical protein
MPGFGKAVLPLACSLRPTRASSKASVLGRERSERAVSVRKDE